MKMIKVKNGHRIATSKIGDKVSFELKSGDKLLVTEVYYREMTYRVISSVAEEVDEYNTVRIFEDEEYNIYFVGYGTNIFQINELIMFDKLNDALKYIE